MYTTDLSNEHIISTTASGKKIHWMLTSEIGAPNFELRYIEIPPNVPRSRSSRHPHEHEVFVVKGQGILEGEEHGKTYSIDLVPGRAVFIPGNEEHQWLNPYDEPLCIICVVPKGAEAESKPHFQKKR